MEDIRRFLTAMEVSQIIGTSVGTSYRIIKIMNEDLKKKGKIIIPGKISRRYFEEKVNL